LVSVLQGYGIPSAAAEQLGWRHLSNGELVTAAAREGFACILTRDRLFGESAARVLSDFPHFAIVVITLPQVRWPQFQQAFRSAWERAPIGPVEGRVTTWP
jgi:predicted nuclease of predicted toxin-antitoxin system